VQLPKRPCLRDELYLLAHKPNGAERVHRPGLSLALAAATLTDLQLWGRIDVVSETRLRIKDLRATPDTIANATLEYLSDLEDRGRRDLRHAIHHVGDTLYDQTSASLQMSQLVARRVTKKWFAKDVERYHHTLETVAHCQWLGSMLHYRTQVGKTVDDQSAVLCAMVAVLGLHRQLVHANVSDADLIGALREPVAAMTGDTGNALRWLVAAAEERIGSHAVAAVR
jgi:hypothetical protein